MILDAFVSAITEHCNLNCYYCGSYAPVAKPQFVSIDSFRKDWTKLASLNPNLNIVLGGGGEPTLHPGLLDFFEVAREIFPHYSWIRMATNGVLLASLGKDFWESLVKNRIQIAITRYPGVDINEASINVLVRHYGITLLWEPADHAFVGQCKDNTRSEFRNKESILTGGKPFREMFTQPIDITGSQDIQCQWDKCWQRNNCTKEIRNGRLYKCVVASHIHNLIEHFKLDIENSDENSLDIHSVQSIEEIADFLGAPAPLCKYCRINEGQYIQECYRRSNKELKEWT